MATVNGALGPIDTAALGFTLMHEHIVVANWAMRQAFADWVDRPALIERAVAALRAVKERGVRTLVDLTPINLGRDITVIREVAERAGMQVIVATGFYWNDEPWMIGWDADRLVERVLPDITDGIAGTGVKAGIIKAGTDRPGVTPINKKLLQVAARLHRATGVPISTHTDARHKTGLAQQEVFAEEGVDLTRVVIGHCGDTEDLDYLEQILRRGSAIGLDRFGVDTLLPMEKRVAVTATLCGRGWVDQLVLSHDASCHLDFFPAGVLRSTLPRWNFHYIPDAILPALRAAGVGEAHIQTMTVDNPRRLFEHQGAY